MSQLQADIPPDPIATPARLGYWTLVFRELEKSRTAVVGLWSIGLLFAVGIFAPLLSHNQPFVLRESSGWSSPWVRSLFDRLQFENAVDVFFNLLLVAGPLYVLGYFLARRRYAEAFAAKRARVVLALVGAHFLLFASIAPERHLGFDNPLFYSRPVVNYRVEVERLKSAGESPTAVFPPAPVQLP